MDKVQEFHLELLKTVKFKNISGEKIAADLLVHGGEKRACRCRSGVDVGGDGKAGHGVDSRVGWAGQCR